MAVINKKLLLEAGVHFGHNARRWCPKMKEYVFEERNGIFIIDLKKTEELVEDAYKALYTIAQNGGRVVFVGTRKLIQDVIKEEATRCGQYYVDQRWLGGTLTNFKTIKKSIARLEHIEGMEADGTFDLLPKKEVSLLLQEKEKLAKFFTGIRDMKELPQAMVVVDPKTEHNAVREARKLNIPIFGLVDTNCDPDDVDYVIPGNDDAVRSVKLIVATLANAIVEANGGTPIVIEFPDEPEEKPQRPGKPRYNKERKVEETAAPAPVEEAPATEEVAPAPKKARAKKAVVEEAPAEAPAEEAAPAPKKTRAKKAAPAEDAPATEEAPAPKKRATKKSE